MKKILLALLVTCSFIAKAQVYNNEWIDYAKTYYKFKVVKDGVYRITQSTLAVAGLGSAPAENFQLWRNGVQVPIYTSVGSGVLSSSDYIEFWGQMNDGKPDKELYRDPSFQLNDKWSLISDTAVYFLTVSPEVNRRLQNSPNNVAGNSLPAEPYFLYTTGVYFKDHINPGIQFDAGEPIYSSSYDKGEGWVSNNLSATWDVNGFHNDSLVIPFNNLFPYNGGPTPKLKIAMSGNSLTLRKYKVTVNSDSITGNYVNQMDISIDSGNISQSRINAGNINVAVTNMLNCTPPNCPALDNMVVHKVELTYARQFNFGDASNFEFSLPASATGNYLVISNFSFGITAPVLYDFTNGKRYVADIASAPLVRIALPPSATTRRLVLVSEDAQNITSISSLQTKTFVNYTSSANAGNFLIISHPALFNGANGSNPVEDYRAYRSSVPGGSYNAKIYLSDELVDQFAFGIRKSPAGIRNFIRYARNKFSQAPKFVFIIGKGIDYSTQRGIETANNPADIANANQLNLVPTFGWPASDILLAADPGTSNPQIPIGRLSVINAAEAALYLKKVKDYELAQQTNSPKLQDKLWMKNVAHIVGTNDPGLDAQLSQYMDNYKQIIQDTLFGAKVSTFRKTTASTGDLTTADLTNLINSGTSMITYFGHSAATVLDFNLDEPENYTNQGKYPLFVGLGCNAGNFFKYDPVRFTQKETISEKYVLAQDRGTIGFIASTYFGIVYYLDIWNNYAYNRISRTDYGRPIGEIMKKTADDVFNYTLDDFFARANVEQTELHGDPAITLNTHPKPDYVVEDPTVKISPSFVSIADSSFKVQTIIYNIGKAVDGQLVVETKRQYPGGKTEVIHRDTIPAIRYADSITVNVHIDPLRDKGTNKIIITVDPDNVYDEIYKSNNTVTKDIVIYEDEARTVYPYPFAIVNKQNIKLVASTANPLSLSHQYRMELDTTELFNSPVKVTKSVTQIGGILEFDPGVTFKDSTVYYWRVGLVPATGTINWSTSSFVYLSNYGLGFNQSHVYQHMKSTFMSLGIDSSSNWNFGNSLSSLTIKNGVFPTAATQAVDFSIYVNGNDFINSVCGLPNIIVNVFDQYSFQPWYNADPNQPGQYGSDGVCGPGREWNFQYTLTDPNKRKSLIDFLDRIPSGDYVVIRNISGTDPNNNYFANQWKSDAALFGAGNTIYDRLYNQGFVDADSFYRPRAFIFTYKKDGKNVFQPQSVFSEGINDRIQLSANYPTRDTLGFVTSPVLGPAKAWSKFYWRGTSLDPNYTDDPMVSIMGIKTDGTVDTLISGISPDQQVVDVSFIDAKKYPYLQLYLRNMDSINKTPFQLKYWRLTYTPVPEGALASNLLLQKKDTVEIAEPEDFRIGFKNISDVPFDSVKIKLIVTDTNNVQHVVPPFKMKPLASGDMLNIRDSIDTRQLVGSNVLYVEVNPDNDQPEQYHFNNYAFYKFYVKGDTTKPLLDVTFDNVHILNNDIVSSKPDILIKLKDETKWYLLNDPSTVKVQVKFPNGTLHNYAFNSDTLKFNAATGAPNTDNTATVNFRPAFLDDGLYTMTITGKDMSSNQAGTVQYLVNFYVNNTPMISNMLNYPNPFTTSTAFVFTITGSEVPQNIRIQILTVTGKVVKDITKNELGPLHIGRNITEYKWDGTDQYGQKLANGVYLYRVITNLNGKSLDKLNSQSCPTCPAGSVGNTDQYFNKGYGKMYLMR